MGKKNSGKDFLVGAIVGGLIGAATAIFLSPNSGQDLRQKINNNASVVKEKTNTLSKSVTEQANQILNKVKDRNSSSESNFDLTNNKVEKTESTGSNEQLFKEKLAEAEKALLEAESGVK